MQRATTVCAVVLGLLVAGCSGRTPAPKTAGGAGVVPTRPGAVAPARIDPSSADAELIITMYDDISRAFQRNPDDGVRAIIAAQDPQDRLDVDLARCIDAVLPGAAAVAHAEEPASRRLMAKAAVEVRVRRQEHRRLERHARGARGPDAPGGCA